MGVSLYISIPTLISKILVQKRLLRDGRLIWNLAGT